MIEFSKKEKRNDKEMAQFIFSFSRRQTTAQSKLNITSFSEFLEDIEESENPKRNIGHKIPEKENKMLEDANYIDIKFPFLANSVLNDINDNNSIINETKIRSFLYN